MKLIDFGRLFYDDDYVRIVYAFHLPERWNEKTRRVSREAVRVSYNMDFSISDVNAEDVLSKVTKIANLPLYKVEKLKNIVKADLKSVDEETLSAIYEEIDTMAKISEVQQPPDNTIE